jgi:hypothetical protein
MSLGGPKDGFGMVDAAIAAVCIFLPSLLPFQLPSTSTTSPYEFKPFPSTSTLHKVANATSASYNFNGNLLPIKGRRAGHTRRRGGGQ